MNADVEKAVMDLDAVASEEDALAWMALLLALRDQEALLRDIKAWDLASALDPKRESLFALPLDLRQRITAHLGAEQ